MRHSRFLTSLLLLCVCCMAIATPLERITLNNGSIYEGYTIENKGENIKFVAEKSIVHIKKTSNVTISNKLYALEKLAPEWKSWVEENPIYAVFHNGEKSLCLSRISTVDSKEVFLLEEGDNYLKYLSFESKEVSLNHAEISTIEIFPRTFIDLSGIDVEVQLKDSVAIFGQIVCKTGTSIKLLTDDKITKSIPYDKVTKITRHRLNDGLSIMEQTPFLDKLLLKNNKEVEGLITVETHNNDNDYMLVETLEGDLVHVNKSDIVSIGRIINDNYVSLKDVEIPDSAVMIDGVLCDKIDLEIQGDVFVVNDSIAPIIVGDNDSEEGAEVCIVMSDSKQNADFKVVKVQKKTVEREISRRKKEKVEVLEFTYKDIVDSSINEDTSLLSPLGNMHRTYILTKGLYVLFNAKTKDCYYITVE